MKLGRVGFEQSSIPDENQGFPESRAQNPAHARTISSKNIIPAEHPQGENSADEFPGNHSQNSQKPSGLDTDKLAEILRTIPAEHRAEYLRTLADRLDSGDIR